MSRGAVICLKRMEWVRFDMSDMIIDCYNTSTITIKFEFESRANNKSKSSDDHILTT